MEHEADKQFFVFRVVRAEIFVSHPTIQVAQLSEMLRHVSRHHCLYNDMADTFEIGTTHSDLPGAVLVLCHELERGCQVMVLQNAHIVMSYRYLIIHIDKEGVGYTWVLEIVQRCTDIATHLLKVVELNSIFDSTVNCEVVECLADICGVRLVVVCDGLIASCQIPYEAHQVGEVYVTAANQSMLG